MNDWTKEKILEAVQKAIKNAGNKWVPFVQFLEVSKMKKSDFFKYFPKYSDAVKAAGLDIEVPNEKANPADLLNDWGGVVRQLGQIPTRNQYQINGIYSVGVFDKKFGPWSGVPARFREFSTGKPEWADVVALLPKAKISAPKELELTLNDAPLSTLEKFKGMGRFERRNDRPTYGDPIDFRGLRHAPVNESGVVFLFGMVAREMGYLVEAVQAGFPDCEAKRQIGPGKWQRVRIEFEFESRNFVDHGHAIDG